MTDRQGAIVSEVLAGDLVRLQGGRTLRYAGLEAPPLEHKIPLVRTYGANSKAFNASLVLGKAISIEWGSQLRDSRGNLLGYVFLEDGRMVNRQILQSGNAKVRVVAPNLTYTKEFHDDEMRARRERRGLWAHEPVDPFARTEFLGEINTKVYYYPDSPELSRIPQAQLVRFRSRVEATAAGYRACSTCKESTRTDEESVF